MNPTSFPSLELVSASQDVVAQQFNLQNALNKQREAGMKNDIVHRQQMQQTHNNIEHLQQRMQGLSAINMPLHSVLYPTAQTPATVYSPLLPIYATMYKPSHALYAQPAPQQTHQPLLPCAPQQTVQPLLPCAPQHQQPQPQQPQQQPQPQQPQQQQTHQPLLPCAPQHRQPQPQQPQQQPQPQQPQHKPNDIVQTMLQSVNFCFPASVHFEKRFLGN